MPRMMLRLLLLGLAVFAPHSAFASEIATASRSFTDETRTIKASMGFAGSDIRRIDVRIWHPSDLPARRLPLIVYSHGTFGSADNAMHIVRSLVDAGYIVAAPDYPLTSRAAFTKVRFADISDVAQQVADLSFVIDSILVDPVVGPMIDPLAIGTTGHSLGGVTSYFASFGQQVRDPRIVATAPIGAGDPVQSALSSEMGLAGTRHAEVSVPVLFVSAQHDLFARTTGRPYAAYARVEGPKYELMIDGGTHVWFRDGLERHPDGKNPDCLFFERNMPGTAMPGCEVPVTLIDPEEQQRMTRIALVTFFDAYLKKDAAALRSLTNLGARLAGASFVHQVR